LLFTNFLATVVSLAYAGS